MLHLTLLSIFRLNSGLFLLHIYALVVFDILIHFSLHLQVVDINIYTYSHLKPALDYFLP